MAKPKVRWDWISRICLRAASSVIVLTVVLGLAVVVPRSAQAQKFETLYRFRGAHGEGPDYGSLSRDAAGNLYGTTDSGGALGLGNVFKLNTARKVTVLYSFTGGSDGANPYGGVTTDREGSLYGTTASGGDLSCGGGYGCGTVFKLDTTGRKTILHFFNGNDGDHPYAGLLLDAKGDLYGSTEYGGSNYGTVFKVSVTGKYRVLHRFEGQDGEYPGFGSLVRDADGNLYGTTYKGGRYGEGTVFKVSKTGKERVLYSFGTQGAQPLAGLFLDEKGNLYGTTTMGGASNAGTVFRLEASGKYAVLYSFTGGADGAAPDAGVCVDSNGILYGTATLGGDVNCNGSWGCGTVFKLEPSGKVTVLHTFTGNDGALPMADLIKDTAGTFYGTTYLGGHMSCNGDGCGVVFKFTP